MRPSAVEMSGSPATGKRGRAAVILESVKTLPLGVRIAAPVVVVIVARAVLAVRGGGNNSMKFVRRHLSAQHSK